jgi:hypothetical protein
MNRILRCQIKTGNVREWKTFGLLLDLSPNHRKRSGEPAPSNAPTRWKSLKYANTTAACLDLRLTETVLPDNDIWSGAILTVVHQDNPKYVSERFEISNRSASYIPSGFIDSPV